jgi:hypothetical protein
MEEEAEEEADMVHLGASIRCVPSPSIDLSVSSRSRLLFNSHRDVIVTTDVTEAIAVTALIATVVAGADARARPNTATDRAARMEMSMPIRPAETTATENVRIATRTATVAAPTARGSGIATEAQAEPAGRRKTALAAATDLIET